MSPMRPCGDRSSKKQISKSSELTAKAKSRHFALAYCLSMIFSENRHPPSVQVQGRAFSDHALAAEQSLTSVEKFLRVDGFAFDANFIMHMWSGRAPGRAKLADDAACAHGVAGHNVDLGEMTVAGHQPIAVVDLDHLAIAAARARERDGARGGRMNGIAGIAAEIDPGMHCCFVDKRIHANAEW